MLRPINPAELIREVVRGERHWSDLRLIGVEIDQREGDWSITYAGDVCSTPDLSDVAMGFDRFRTSTEELQSWAHVLLGGSAFLDFSGMESTPSGEVLVEALWDAAESGVVSAAAAVVISRFR